MKARLFTVLLALCSVPLLAQTHTFSTTVQTSVQNRVAQTHTSDFGFSYSLPLDWEIVDIKPMLPAIRQKETEAATSGAEKKGIACTQIALVAKNGNPSSISVIDAMAVPYSCFGRQLTDADIPSLAKGIAEGLKRLFVVSDTVSSSYKLGAHSLWIERAHGSVIARPDVKRTLEITCSLLQKGAVCWMAQAADQESLETFERGAVTLDGEAAPALVPANAFQEKQTIKTIKLGTGSGSPEKR
jgi:hypothetical protein